MVYFLTVRNPKGQLKSLEEVFGNTTGEVVSLIQQKLNSRKYKDFEKKNYKISFSEKLQAKSKRLIKSYRKAAFLAICNHYDLTETEEAYAEMLCRGIERNKMIRIIYRLFKVIVSQKTVDSHCYNVQTKTRSNSDAEVRSKFLP